MKKIIVSTIVISLLLSMAPLSMGGKEDGTIIYVDDDNTEGPWDRTLEHPYQLIQDGVDNASDGDTVFVFSGTYYENVIVNKQINLIGENRLSTIIDGSESGHVVHISVEEVTVSGFTIQNSSGGHPDSYWGIYLCTNNNIISNNIITDNFRGVTFSHSNYNIISNNIIISNILDGLNLYNSNSNEIIDNVIVNNGGEGISQGSSNNNIISGNNVSSNTGYGICVTGSDYNIISDNIVTTNRWGIVISYGSSNNIIDNNTVSNNEHHGINLQQGPNNNIIENNNVSNNIVGITLYLNSWNNIISGNKVTNNSATGIKISGSDSYDNIICENSVRNHPFSISLISQCNNNHIYHNNIINFSKVYDTGVNNWDNGYPSGGNFFSDYSGNDSFHGPNQDIPGSDGIGDTPHSIYGGSNKDKYPLMDISGWINYPPNAPSIDGLASGKAGVEYDYKFVAADPEGYDVYYVVDWGDGTNTSWIGPYVSGEEATVSHTWSEQGTYTISAKAKDTRDAEGDWATLDVTMPLNQPSSQSHPQSNPSPSQQSSSQTLEVVKTARMTTR